MMGPAVLRDPLLLLIYITLALFALALVFAVLVFVLHFGTTRRHHRFQAIERGWEPQLLEAFLDESVEPSKVHVEAGHERHFLSYLVRFARRVRGPEREALKVLAQPMLRLILPQLESARPELRARAVQTLATLGLPGHATPVLAALDDPSEMVAMTAARALARREYPQYAEAVLARLHRFDEWHAHYLSALLAGIGPEAAPALRAKLADTTAPPRTRAVAAAALTTLRDLEAAAAAAAALQQTDDPALLQGALQLLGAVGGPDILPLVRAHVDHPLPFVRAEALGALALLGTVQDMELLERALADVSPWVALHAGHALGSARQLDRLRAFAAREDQSGIVAREVLSEVRA